MAECGDILLAIKEKSITENSIHGEIGEVLGGQNGNVTVRVVDVKTGEQSWRKDTGIGCEQKRHFRAGQPLGQYLRDG